MMQCRSALSLKCLSAFGFWGTSPSTQAQAKPPSCLKCLSALGFWGTPLFRPFAHTLHTWSQMPFGFWVLGNCSRTPKSPARADPVSNAFRLLGSGELGQRTGQSRATCYAVSNAFRLLGSGEPKAGKMEPCQKKMRLKCLSAFGFWGTRQVLGEALKAEFGLKCLSAFGFWGTLHARVGVILHDSLSQMPFGFWVLGNSANVPRRPRTRATSLKCLSAFGFWGTERFA